jgi:hypothetical protein
MKIRVLILPFAFSSVSAAVVAKFTTTEFEANCSCPVPPIELLQIMQQLAVRF